MSSLEVIWDRFGASWASWGRLWVMLGALGTHGKRQGVQVGATNRMLAVLVDQNHAVEKREGILRGPSWGCLGMSWGHLGSTWGRFTAVWVSWEHVMWRQHAKV